MTIPIVTYIIIGITCLVSWQAFNDTSIFHKYLFNAYQIRHRKEWYRFFSHGLIHADIGHLLFNMLSLYFLGQHVEMAFIELFGPLKGILLYILLYVSALIMSSLFSYEKHKENMYYNAVGASGAISAVVFAWVLMFPTGKLMLLLLPIPIPGFIFGILYLFISSILARRGGDNIGHDAHFWGGVYGLLFPIVFKFELFWHFLAQVKQYMADLF